MKKTTDSIDEFDFGFSFLDEDYETVKSEQVKVKQEFETIQEQVEELQSRVELLYNSILPFLDNLCKNPEKSTIHWPNRVSKIEQFKKHLKQISEGTG
jgi:archaellum component FlaC